MFNVFNIIYMFNVFLTLNIALLKHVYIIRYHIMFNIIHSTTYKMLYNIVI